MTGTQVRATFTVSVVLVLAFVVTGFLSASYKNARQIQGREHYQRGQALASSGNVQGAAEEYRKALLFLPDDHDYRISLCVALIELGKLDEAESHLQQLRQEEPTDGLVNVMLARVAIQRNKPEQAIEYFQRAVYGYWPRDKLPARHAARWELVSLLEAQNRRTELVGELLQLYANTADLKEKSKIGFVLLQYGAVSDAANVFHELARDSPRFAEAFFGLGQAYFSDANYVSARREYAHAVHLDAGNREYAEKLALANEIVELDPLLPNIKTAERLRKSRTLLNRVIADLSACRTPGGPSEPSEIAGARKLAQSNSNDRDQLSDDLQNAAQQLWKNRQTYCGLKARPDPALEMVLSRMAQ